jgi:hypothetical protein
MRQPTRTKSPLNVSPWILRALVAGAACFGCEELSQAQGVVGAAFGNMLAGGAAIAPPGQSGPFVGEQGSEPLGFSEARFTTSEPVDPAINSGFLLDDAPLEEYYDPQDPESPAPTVSSGEWIRNGIWYTQQDAIYWTRSVSVKNITRLATDLSSASLPKDFASLEIAPSMGYAPGLRSTIGLFLGRDPRNRDHAVEFTFLGLTHWQDAASLTAKLNGAIVSDIDPTRFVPAFNGSNFQSYFQSSKMNSWELNYRINRRLGRDQMIWTRDSNWVRRVNRDHLYTIFGGLRVISIAETLHYDANSTTATGTYDVATHNNLIGLQAGGEYFYEHYEWRFGGRLKGGGLVNFDNQSSRVRVLNGAGIPLLPNRDEFAKDHTLGFVGELNVIGAYQFTPNFAFRTSYDLMFVTELALTQNQITFSPSTPVQISTSHSLFFQGVSIGFEWVR